MRRVSESLSPEPADCTLTAAARPPKPIRTAWDTRGRTARLAVAAVILLTAFAVGAWWLAAQRIEGAIRGALGPRSEVGAVTLGWRGVAVHGLRVTAAPGAGWPAADEIRAARILVQPDLWAAWRGRTAVRRVVVENGYVSLLRTRSGTLRVLPALTEAPPAVGASAPRPGPAFDVGEVELVRSEVAFYDASVQRPPLALRLTDFEARIGPLAQPVVDRATRLSVKAVVKRSAASAGRDGHLDLDGEFNALTRDARLVLKLRGVDLVALQPYLTKVAEGGVKRGTLDLDLSPSVKGQHLKAPGRLTLTGLELGAGGLAGVPRQAVLGFLSHDDRIELDFTLEGRLDDPGFSLNENLATRVATALAQKLGVSVGGVVEGVGSVIKGLFGR